jgi:hypothetical protein
MAIGLEATKATQNILRLLESSHGSLHHYAQDTHSLLWHSSGLSWSLQNGDWVAQRGTEAVPPTTTHAGMSTLSWLQFSDDRTALAKLIAFDGSVRYLSLLRVDNPERLSSSMIVNDGWVIVREVTSPTIEDEPEGALSPLNVAAQMTSLLQCLTDYLEIEHGGGSVDSDKAKELFLSDDASLLTVGTASEEEGSSDWSAPAGCFLEIPIQTYFDGVLAQSPHGVASRMHDAILQLDCSGPAAAATVKVGNGAQTFVFCDHLLLGHVSSDRDGGGGWKILSKTFAPSPWPI